MTSTLLLAGLALTLQVPSPTATADLSAELGKASTAIQTREAVALRALADRLQARSETKAAGAVRDLLPAPPTGVATRIKPLPPVVEPHAGLASVPSRPAETKSKAPASPSSDWEKELKAIRSQSVKDLLDLVRKAAKADPPHLAKAGLYLRMILERDPDHAEARRLLGYVPYDGGWARPFAVDKLKNGFVAHPVYGWMPADWIMHLELGELPAPTIRGQSKTTWLPADEADKLRVDWRPPWTIRTEHFEVQTNVPLAEAIVFSRRLEAFYDVFFALTADVVGENLHLAQRLRSPSLTGVATYQQHRILYFADHDEYLRRVRTVTSDDVSNSLGYYDPPKPGKGNRATAYFFRDVDGQLPVTATLYHEVSHQLLFETAGRNAYTRNVGNYWVFEGLGTYFETVETLPDKSIEVGGRVGARLEEAVRSLKAGKFMPLAEFLQQDQPAFNREERIYVNYQQAMALTVFLMQADQGAHREPFLDYVRDAYRGRIKRSSGRSLEDRLDIPVDQLERRFKAFYANPPAS
ncbi:MAG: DUF1570 domain-containing protein [Paludisphaera borealis]|uniref:DUF1570 domain-containing protein n=1 Tax=Paludisphaera borealis TaxID=1387353 RepID=UPI00284E1B08|nr:DUF1570 domain-containing protein [Paludisphaera borealis]MDR3618487.1 DUF1570 domain-containing protein [Paludisphaera borealis]